MNSAPNAQPALLQTLANAFYKISDPRHKRGIRHPFAGMLAHVSVEEFQAAFAEFLNVLLAESDDTLTVAVDGCSPHGRILVVQK